MKSAFQTNNVPNLDSMSPDELRALDRETQLDLQSAAKRIFPDMTRDQQPAMARRATYKLAAYARWKASAIEARSAGEIAIALVIERSCQSKYDQLPAWARW